MLGLNRPGSLAPTGGPGAYRGRMAGSPGSHTVVATHADTESENRIHAIPWPGATASAGVGPRRNPLRLHGSRTRGPLGPGVDRAWDHGRAVPEAGLRRRAGGSGGRTRRRRRGRGPRRRHVAPRRSRRRDPRHGPGVAPRGAPGPPCTRHCRSSRRRDRRGPDRRPHGTAPPRASRRPPPGRRATRHRAPCSARRRPHTAPRRPPPSWRRSTRTWPSSPTERFAHPGWLIRFANAAMASNVSLGPWIHVESEAAHLGAVTDGAELRSARGSPGVRAPRARYALHDGLLVTTTGAGAPEPVACPVKHVHHRVIYRLRG